MAGGTDANHFTLGTDGALQFVVAPDFERPADSDRDNRYEVRLRGLDAAGNASVQTLTVTVADRDAEAKMRELITYLELHLELVARELYGEAFFGGKVSDEERERLRLQVLRSLIDETLQVQEAVAQEMEVTAEEVNDSYASFEKGIESMGKLPTPKVTPSKK